MNKKISQFDVATSLNTGDILTIVQEGTNKQISKEDFNTSLSDTFATNDKVAQVEEDVDNLETKVDSNYTDLSNKIVEGDTNVTNNLTSTVNSYYDVLNNKIITLEDKHDSDLDSVNNTVQEWIDEIDDKSTLDQLHDALNKITVLENLVTQLAQLISEGGGGSGEVPGFHTQSTATIFPLSGYYYTGDTNDLTTTDTLNQALSKLEGKIRSVEGSIGGDTKYMITSYDNTAPTDGNLYSARRSDMNYISKKTDDTANGYIKFLKGIQGGQTFREGFLGEGASLYPVNGRWKFEVDDLFVRGAMTVNELIVNEIKATGGDILVTIADIEIIDVSTTDTNDYKCKFDTQDGTKHNPFVEGDQAICQIFDGKNVKRYWRMVSEVGDDYIVLSQSVCEPGSAVPEVGDKVLQLGNRYPDHTDRRSAIMISARGSEGPSITFYDNIDDFNLVGKEYTRISKNSKFVGTISQVSGNGDIVRVPIDRGQYIPGTTYYHYDRVSYDGRLWLCMAISTTAEPSVDNEEWLLQVDKGEAGQAGDDVAKWVEIVGDRLFMYDNPDFTGTPEPASITLTCNTYGMENPTYVWINKATNLIISNSRELLVTPSMFGDRRNMMVRCTVTYDGKDYYDETQLAKLGDGAQGENAYYIDLSNGNMTIPYDSSGNNPLITITDVYTYVYAYYGTNPLVIQEITANTVEGAATVNIEGDKVSLTSLGSPSARIQLHVKINDNITLTKDLWINKVHNGENGFDGVDASYVMLSGEQIFKYDQVGAVTPSAIKLYATVYGLNNPTYKWFWSVAGENNWAELKNEVGNILVVSPTGDYFKGTVNEVTFKVEVTTAAGGGPTYTDMMTINKVFDGKDGVSPYRGVLSNESHTVPATYDGIVDSADLANAKTTYTLYQGTRELEASEYTITYTNLDDNTQNQLAHDTDSKTLTVARLGNSYNSTVFKVEFKVDSSVVDVCDFTITKAKGGVPGDYEISVYCRSNESQPGTPTFNNRPSAGGSYSNGNYWYVDAPASNGYAIWKSTALFDGKTGLKKSGESWTTPTKISGIDGQDGSGTIMVFKAYSKTSTPSTPTGSNVPPSGWYTSPPAYDSSYQALYMSKATVGTNNQATSSWSTPRPISGPAGPAGATGASGPALNIRGEYVPGARYYRSKDLVDIVYHTGTEKYYMVSPRITSTTATPGSSSEWTVMNSFENLATKLFFAEEATIGGWVFSKANESYIRSVSNTVRLDGSSSPKDNLHFAIGANAFSSPSSAVLRIDKTGKLFCSNVELTGKITANSGKIGGFSIENSWLKTDTSIANNATFISMTNSAATIRFGQDLVPSSAGGSFTLTSEITNNNTQSTSFLGKTQNCAIRAKATKANRNIGLYSVGKIISTDGVSWLTDVKTVWKTSFPYDELHACNEFVFQLDKDMSFNLPTPAQISNAWGGTTGNSNGADPQWQSLYTFTLLNTRHSKRLWVRGVSEAPLVNHDGAIHNPGNYTYGTEVLYPGDVCTFRYFNRNWHIDVISRK